MGLRLRIWKYFENLMDKPRVEEHILAKLGQLGPHINSGYQHYQNIAHNLFSQIKHHFHFPWFLFSFLLCSLSQSFCHFLYIFFLLSFSFLLNIKAQVNHKPTNSTSTSIHLSTNLHENKPITLLILPQVRFGTKSK